MLELNKSKVTQELRNIFSDHLKEGVTKPFSSLEFHLQIYFEHLQYLASRKESMRIRAATWDGRYFEKPRSLSCHACGCDRIHLHCISSGRENCKHYISLSESKYMIWTKIFRLYFIILFYNLQLYITLKHPSVRFMSPQLDRMIRTSPMRRGIFSALLRYLMPLWPIDICWQINMPLENLVTCGAGSFRCVFLFLMCFPALNPTWHLQHAAIRALFPWKWLCFAFQIRKIRSLVNVNLGKDVNIDTSGGCDECHA